MPPARPSAVSTESVMRCLLVALAVSRSTTASIVCFSCFFSRGGSVSGVHDAVHPDPGVPLDLQVGEQVDVLAFSLPDHRGQDLEPGALGHLENAVDDLLRGLLGDRLPADRAVRPADAGEQQPEIVVDLGDRADRRARVAARRLLVDRHCRGQSLDEVNVGFVHLPEELPRVCG